MQRTPAIKVLAVHLGLWGGGSELDILIFIFRHFYFDFLYNPDSSPSPLRPLLPCRGGGGRERGRGRGRGGRRGGWRVARWGSRWIRVNTGNQADGMPTMHVCGVSEGHRGGGRLS